jgi:hypothetical protein
MHLFPQESGEKFTPEQFGSEDAARTAQMGNPQSTHLSKNSSSDGSTATQKVNNENDKRHHQQQMDQTAGHVKTEAEKP